MAVMDQIIGLVSPAAALRRATSLRESGRAAEAFPLLARAAHAGIAEAESVLAQSYFQGYGVPASQPEGLRWLKRAATHGHIEAQALLSSLYLQGLAGAADEEDTPSSALFAGEEKTSPNFEAAAKWAQQAAASGSASAQALLGYIFTSGPHSFRNLDLAHRCYERSAAGGCPQGHLGFALSLARRAQDATAWRQVAEALQRASQAGLASGTFLLGVLFDEGRPGLESDPVRAIQLYEQAAEQGLADAQVRLGTALIEGRGIEQDHLAGESWLRRAAHAGDARAAALVGDLYAKGGSLPPNYTEAAHWYRRAAEAGDVAAARALASLYLTGAGTPKNSEEAARWLGRAAEAGDAAARTDLANLVARGGGKPEDRDQVLRWFADDAIAGDLVASFNVAMCFAKGIGLGRDDQKAADWVHRAAEGLPEAQYVYGRMLAEGRGVMADLAAARTWFARAADAGFSDGEVALAEMLLNGRGGERNTEKAIALFGRAGGQGA
jgi:TPR repeat protein